ncbi:hypothetical protein CC86DRAFT_401497 [Ophiobolus disseminans]|uniref:Uncharacterized protein n=1 Tax=Ophiobolus disseminans TaxID=1469910 RepID=A0A6A7AJA7_9PLEO|nr:hypothetical protein CC86DRAFT_401497 [Ophiobolus disseminans]
MGNIVEIPYSMDTRIGLQPLLQLHNNTANTIQFWAQEDGEFRDVPKRLYRIQDLREILRNGDEPPKASRTSIKKLELVLQWCNDLGDPRDAWERTCFIWTQELVVTFKKSAAKEWMDGKLWIATGSEMWYDTMDVEPPAGIMALAQEVGLPNPSLTGHIRAIVEQ